MINIILGCIPQANCVTNNTLNITTFLSKHNKIRILSVLHWLYVFERFDDDTVYKAEIAGVLTNM